jgi:hypothetical protein
MNFSPEDLTLDKIQARFPDPTKITLIGIKSVFRFCD